MYLLTILTLMTIMISLIIMLLASILSKKIIKDREKAAPFECGFDPLSSSRIPFSIRFFLIAIIFLIFDVEIALILPLPLIFKSCSIFSWMISSLLFILILLMGLFHEWNQGALNWTK